MRVWHPWLFALVVVASVGASRTAAAQVDTTAELAFNEGREILFPKGKPAKDLTPEVLATACQKLQKSVDIEPALGALNLLGYCRDKQGMYASALDAYLRAARTTVVATGDKKKDADSRAKVKRADDESKRLQDIVSTFRITVPESARVTDLVVQVGSQTYGTLKWDVPIPVDGGTYAVRASAPGYLAWESSLTVAAQQAREEVVIPLLVPERAAEPPVEDPVVEPDPVAPDPIDAPMPELPRADDGGGGGMTGMRKAAIVVGAVGVVTLGVAVVFEVNARGTYDDYLASQPEDLSLLDDADAKRNTAIGLAIGGGVAVGAGVVMWMLGVPVEATVDRDSAMVSLRGGF